MQKQYALNKLLTFVIPMQSIICSFVCQFDSETLIKSTSNQKVLQPKGNNMQRRIQNPAKHLRWNFLQKQVKTSSISYTLSVRHNKFAKQLFNYFFKKIQKQPPQVKKQSPEGFCKKGVLKNFANFTLKQLCWSIF